MSGVLSHVQGAEPPGDCPLCGRLRAFLRETSLKHPEWHNKPVASFGDPDARLLIVGLAPGLQGANRTGRPFTGDYAGDLLYATLAKFGFANTAFRADPTDGLRLYDTMITNAVRCVPPANKPTGAEINTCRQFLIGTLSALPNLEAIVALGRISHDSVVRALGGRLKDAPFAHGAHHTLANLHMFDSYHCSRYNTNTGRLTTDMFEAVFASVQEHLGK